MECLICYVLEAFVPEDRNLATVLRVYKTFSGLGASYIEKNGIPFLEDWSILRPDSNAVRGEKAILTEKVTPHSELFFG